MIVKSALTCYCVVTFMAVGLLDTFIHFCRQSLSLSSRNDSAPQIPLHHDTISEGQRIPNAKRPF